MLNLIKSDLNTEWWKKTCLITANTRLLFLFKLRILIIFKVICEKKIIQQNQQNLTNYKLPKKLYIHNRRILYTHNIIHEMLLNLFTSEKE